MMSITLPFTAHRQIGLMKSTITAALSGDASHLSKISTVFSASYTSRPKLLQLKAIIDALVVGKLHIKASISPFRGAIASADPEKGEMMIGQVFFEETTPEWLRVVTIVHEASHVFGNTLDFWEYNHDKTKLFPVPAELVREHAINGDMSIAYSEVHRLAPTLTHKNADTWAVFGYFLEHNKLPPPLLPLVTTSTSPAASWHLGIPCTRVSASSIGRSGSGGTSIGSSPARGSVGRTSGSNGISSQGSKSGRPKLSITIPKSHGSTGAGGGVSAHSSAQGQPYSAGHSWADDVSLSGFSSPNRSPTGYGGGSVGGGSHGAGGGKIGTYDVPLRPASARPFEAQGIHQPASLSAGRRKSVQWPVPDAR
ncbi:hypothetical protein CVT24_012792 [Panaeolus cyanescens]|uniref:Uncharacterized protein n=1 Tax=Panaeolus cyanescens TaxID=181874 RepID=A0A409W5X8_9AGAR|nr:hypothetical protein CVT24_012792 [Panaeolus cyanescens]